eukprot:2109023-Pyramimonas_sp.AAC.1
MWIRSVEVPGIMFWYGSGSSRRHNQDRCVDILRTTCGRASGFSHDCLPTGHFLQRNESL